MPLRRGWAAEPSKKMQRYLRRAKRGRSYKKLNRVYDLPRRADLKVAWHLLDRRVGPSSPEGHNGNASLRISCRPAYQRNPPAPPLHFKFTISNFRFRVPVI